MMPDIEPDFVRDMVAAITAERSAYAEISCGQARQQSVYFDVLESALVRAETATDVIDVMTLIVENIQRTGEKLEACNSDRSDTGGCVYCQRVIKFQHKRYSNLT